MSLTQQDVVRAAVDLLDEVGLAGLSLRRLAAKLHVSAPTLYWHVRDKRELLDLMVEEMLRSQWRRGSPKPGQGWEDWLVEQARLQFALLIAHRDGALVAAGNRPTPASLPLIEETIGSLVAVGFPPAEALQVVLTVGHYVIGCAVEFQAEAARQEDRNADVQPAQRYREMGELPNLRAAIEGKAVPDPAGAFEHGLGLLLAGLRARHAELVLSALEP